MRSGCRDTAPRAQAEAREGSGTESERPDLTVEQILAWADAHHAVHGRWPEVGLRSGVRPVDGVHGESWKAINHALALGLRGLPGDSSLAELLAEHRGAPAPDMGPRALAEKIWAWEQEHFPIKGPRCRLRGQPSRPVLSIPEILSWAAAHQEAIGEWPGPGSGLVREAPFELTWWAVDLALEHGLRGLPGGSSLSGLLAEYHQVGPPLTLGRILAWADAHHAITGSWPTDRSGQVLGAPREYWWNLDRLLYAGGRGLEGGLTVRSMLYKYRGVRDPRPRVPLTLDAILGWADAHHAATGSWPNASSGPVTAAPGETWKGISIALVTGRRGLRHGMPLYRLLADRRPGEKP